MLHQTKAARNHGAIMLSNIMQPKAELGMNGQMGLPTGDAQIPDRVNQPADTDPSVRPERTKPDRRADDRVGQFLQTGSAAQVHAARAGQDENRTERPKCV